MIAMKYKINTTSLLEDISKAGKDTVLAAGFTLSFFGLQYINEKFLGNTMYIEPDTPLFSGEFVFGAVQYTCFFGAAVEGIAGAYNTLKVPLKIVTGKYLQKKKKKISKKPAIAVE